MQNTDQVAKFGFYCNATNTFYYFENQEEFQQMMRLVEQTELTDQPNEEPQSRSDNFNDFDAIVDQFRQIASISMEIQLQQVDF